ncbi:DinB family protein [Brachybacterium sp. J153]|uniref:DinB family protein n=1 Tax=Brachybacterium sp. J153 TaxID=3116488 RepID=UPI002E76AA0D|nr:DinB family protein [Brachybacterium sp. J153]MEE1619565.1 DinB family protein [Brachybacterium sp. J153]
MTTTPDNAKATLHRYLREASDALVWKTEGLSERDLRLPRTPTGTTLLGLVKHAANIEAGYFGETFSRPLPALAGLEDVAAVDADPQADWVVGPEQSAAQVLELYARVRELADATIRELPLEAEGHVPWWGERGNPVTLHRILVHVTAELARHAGHADILRELIDESAGLRRNGTNLPGEDYDLAAYRQRLREIADRF